MRDVETMSARLSNANGCDIRIGQETWSSEAILNLSHTFPWGFLDMQCIHYTKKFVFTIVPGKHNWVVLRSANRGWSAATHGTSLGFVYLSAFSITIKECFSNLVHRRKFTITTIFINVWWITNQHFLSSRWNYWSFIVNRFEVPLVFW